MLQIKELAVVRGGSGVVQSVACDIHDITESTERQVELSSGEVEKPGGLENSIWKES